jgi:hypothetical protein
MNLPARSMNSRTRSGQTLIVALLVLGILLILGLVFLGIINRNIVTGGRAQQRSEATDLAEAGVRYAHGQMLRSPLGADWLPQPVAAVTPGDPDIDLVKPGGPDGVGAFSRIEFDRGRALIRVRYAPSSTAVAQNLPEGILRKPGKARNYLMIEAVGRPGRLPASLGADPTIRPEKSRAESRKVIAFVSIGLIETARFVTNKFNSSRAAELGVPSESGVVYDGQDVNVPTLTGTTGTLLNRNGAATLGKIGYGGSIWVNGDLRLHGENYVNLNAALGDLIGVTGVLSGADDQAILRITREDVDNAGNWVAGTNYALQNATSPSLNSRNGSFTTARGVIRDGVGNSDVDGFPRSLRRKDPPSILATDPETGTTRYQVLTQLSGRLVGSGNSGRFGHAQGVYVNNRSDVQIRRDEAGRQEAGSNESLIFDWLNPNNGQENSGWQGAFYVPRGSFVQLVPDGFIITRDGRAPDRERYWRVQDGRYGPRPGGDPDVAADAQPSATARFRLRTIGGTTYVLNTFSIDPATDRTIDINGNLTDAQFRTLGFPFNGVLAFEGNVRVRGTIPTDHQIQLVSNATIYIEGSITKGVLRDDGSIKNSPSRSMLMLAAKDYVALNTSQFFGPSPFNPIAEANEVSGGLAWNPLRMGAGASSLRFRSEMLLDSGAAGANEADPTTWTPYALGYTEYGTSTQLYPGLLLAHTMDDGAGAATFFSLDVNPGLPNPRYNFAMTPTNAATQPWLDAGGTGDQIYGLGSEAWQRYSKFEMASFPLVDGTFNYANGEFTSASSPLGRFTYLTQYGNDVAWAPTSIGSISTNDYLIARAAIAPGNVKIEATIFAEEGSFFVIPGQWFNPNPNDRRDAYRAAISTYQSDQGLTLVQATAAANADRLTNYGAFPEAPFYGEPVDVKVEVIGSVSENMPPPISQQAEWLKKWGWVPIELGASGRRIPSSHTRNLPTGYDPNTKLVVPNLTITYDSALATDRTLGFNLTAPNTEFIRSRVDELGRVQAMPPIPRMPVSPTLAYFGDER